MPKNKSHKGLQKRIKISKTGKIRFRAPNGRHLKSNKTGTAVQSYRKNRYARSGNLRALSKMLFRPLRSEDQHEADELRREREQAAEGATAGTATKSKATPAAKPTAKAAPAASAATGKPGKPTSKPTGKPTSKPA